MDQLTSSPVPPLPYNSNRAQEIGAQQQQYPETYQFSTNELGEVEAPIRHVEVEVVEKPVVVRTQNIGAYDALTHEGTGLKDAVLQVLPESEITGNHLYDALRDTPAEHDAKYLEGAMKGLGTNEDRLIEILVTRSNAQLREIKYTYKQLFDRELKDDIIGDTSGTFRQLLLDLLEANRDESGLTDLVKAKKDADMLYKAGEGKWGTFDDAFVKLLANQSFPQLQLMFDEYENLTGHPFEEALKSQFCGDAQRAFLFLAQFVRNGPVGEEVEMLHKWICQLGAKDELLVHRIASISYNQLGSILDEYKRRYTIPLEQDIEKNAKPSVLKNALIYVIKNYV